MDWSLRPVTPADADFLLRVYASTRADELALTGWTAAQCDAFVRQQSQAQALHYQAHWPDAEHSVLEAGEGGRRQAAGRLWLHRGAQAVHVLDIALLPEWRGQGLGGRCLRQLMAQAESAGQALTIYVELTNPARRLYERLGFGAVGPPEGVHQFMHWHGAVAQSSVEICHEQA